MLYFIIQLLFHNDYGNCELEDYIVTVLPDEVINKYIMLFHDVQNGVID